MANIMRWDPFREMWNMRTALDRFFEEPLDMPHSVWHQSAWDLALDVVEHDDEFVVKASLPGVNPDDLDVTYDSNVLTIKGEIKKEQNVEEERYHLRERRYGSFSRSVSLPSSVKADKIEASYEAGVLTLHLPKNEDARPKRIKVHSVGSKKLIEGKASTIHHN